MKHLPSWFWVAFKHRWKHINRMNNTVSENMGGWMNTYWVQRYLWTRLGQGNSNAGCEPRFDHTRAFDRANWNALWLASRDHGITDHLISILQLICCNQFGNGNVNIFPIHAGVRQGRVLSLRLFRHACWNGDYPLKDSMQKHGSMVLTSAVTPHFYWTYASLMISPYSHEHLQKQWFYWTIWYTNRWTWRCNWTREKQSFHRQRSMSMSMPGRRVAGPF